MATIAFRPETRLLYPVVASVQDVPLVARLLHGRAPTIDDSWTRVAGKEAIAANTLAEINWNVNVIFAQLAVEKGVRSSPGGSASSCTAGT